MGGLWRLNQVTITIPPILFAPKGVLIKSSLESICSIQQAEVNTNESQDKEGPPEERATRTHRKDSNLIISKKYFYLSFIRSSQMKEG